MKIMEEEEDKVIKAVSSRMGKYTRKNWEGTRGGAHGKIQGA